MTPDETPNETVTLQAIEDKIDSLMAAHNEMVEKVNTIITEVSPHIERIGPMLDALLKHPMLRMLVGKQK